MTEMSGKGRALASPQHTAMTDTTTSSNPGKKSSSAVPEPVKATPPRVLKRKAEEIEKLDVPSPGASAVVPSPASTLPSPESTVAPTDSYKAQASPSPLWSPGKYTKAFFSAVSDAAHHITDHLPHLSKLHTPKMTRTNSKQDVSEAAKAEGSTCSKAPEQCPSPSKPVESPCKKQAPSSCTSPSA